MKKILSTALIALSLFTISCTKDKDPDPTPEPVPEKTNEEYLIAKSWRMEEVAYQQGNSTVIRWKRSGGGAEYANDYIKFNTGGVGIYNNTYNQQFETTWVFTDAEKTKVTLVIKKYNNGGPASTNQTVYLENVNAKDASLRYTEIYVNGTTNVMTSVYRTPKP
jgi:hypothetical protein